MYSSVGLKPIKEIQHFCSKNSVYLMVSDHSKLIVLLLLTHYQVEGVRLSVRRRLTVLDAPDADVLTDGNGMAAWSWSGDRCSSPISSIVDENQTLPS